VSKGGRGCKKEGARRNKKQYGTGPPNMTLHFIVPTGFKDQREMYVKGGTVVGTQSGRLNSICDWNRTSPRISGHELETKSLAETKNTRREENSLEAMTGGGGGERKRVRGVRMLQKKLTACSPSQPPANATKRYRGEKKNST